MGRDQPVVASAQSLELPYHTGHGEVAADARFAGSYGLLCCLHASAILCWPLRLTWRHVRQVPPAPLVLSQALPMQAGACGCLCEAAGSGLL